MPTGPSTTRMRRRPTLLALLLLGTVLALFAGQGDGLGLGLALLAALAGFMAAFPLRPRAETSAPSAPSATGAPGGDLSPEVLPDPAIVVDPRIVVTRANRAAFDAFPGLREGQPLALALRDPAALDAIPAVIASGEPRRVEIGGRIPGEPVWEIRLRPIRAGEVPPRQGQGAVALFLRDLSAERRFAAMQVDFVANVSHELRTPLASLSGFVDTLLGPARDDAKARERFLAIMGEQAARMKRLIDDLLRLSKVELNEHVAPTERIDLGAAASHMVSMLSPLAEEREVEVSLNLPEEPIDILGDRDEILRLLENLTENAVKYGGSGGRIEVAIARTESEGGRPFAEIAVRDWGPGIPREHIPRLTERFYRVDVGRSRQQGGTGLGLAIVKHIVGRHRGRLQVESEVGAGSTFRVRLPLAPTS